MKKVYNYAVLNEFFNTDGAEKVPPPSLLELGG